jgi:hypothetical protein
MPRKRLIRWGLAVTGVLLVLAVAGWLTFSHQGLVNQTSAVATARKWARLAPLPRNALDLSVKVSGSPFSREFAIEFRAPSAEVRRWLRDSPGTRDATPALGPDGSVTYSITPGGGAQFAEVIVSDGGTRVRIHTYWS